MPERDCEDPSVEAARVCNIEYKVTKRIRNQSVSIFLDALEGVRMMPNYQVGSRVD